MGGQETFVRWLDVYNEAPKIDKWKFMGLMPDATYSLMMMNLLRDKRALRLLAWRDV